MIIREAANSPEAIVGKLELLTAGMERAMGAIAAHRVGSLEQEVRRQQEGCRQLVDGMQEMLAGESRAAWERALRSPRFSRALHELRASADRYAVVLKHSGRTLKMLRALQAPEPGAVPATSSRSSTVSWHG